MSNRTKFDSEIEKLHLELFKMGALIEEAIENSIEAFKKQDHDLAREIIEKDRDINDMEATIESHCLKLILKQQPVAKDLRIVSTALKMVTDMERIGDHASDIAEIILRIEGEHLFQLIDHIPEMASVTKEMVIGSISAFVNGDMELTKEIIELDNKVDALFDTIKKEIMEMLRNTKEPSDIWLDFLMIAKYFERIGDHAENICEWAKFNETGEYKNNRIL